jgi:hypothetical protein
MGQSIKNAKRTVDVDPIWKRFLGHSQGRFEALVRLSENYKPDYMTIGDVFTPGVYRAEIPSSALSRLAADQGVLSVELREYVVN